MENNSSPLVVIHKVEYITHNHVDLAEVIFRLKRLEQRVAQDTAAETALARFIEELEKQLDDPATKEKIKEITATIKAEKDTLAAGVAAHTPT